MHATRNLKFNICLQKYYEENVLGFSFDTATTISRRNPSERPQINQVGGLQLKK